MMKEIEELIDRCVLLTEKLEGLLEEHPVASGSAVYETAVRVLTMQVNQLQQDVITKAARGVFHERAQHQPSLNPVLH